MKQINHHLSDSLLMAYVAGDLPEAHNLVVATHVSVCDECRARLGAYEALGGAVMANSATADFADLDAGLAACFDKIDRAGQAPAPRRTRAMGVFPAPLVDYVGGGLDAVRWRSVGMGVKQAILPTARGSKARLLYIPPGQAVP
ncbi:MAG: transcriptional regulator, partial [Rhodobacteraceae bacterium]|nr:transcriptional regulator [Paracoccaceae bacterium]